MPPVPRRDQIDRLPWMCSNSLMSPPIVQTLLAADRVARSRTDGRCDLFGVFHALSLSLPTQLTFAVYYVLTGCHGNAELGVHFLDPADEVLAGGPVIVPATDPLAIVQGVAAFDDVRIDRPGTYRLRIDCGGDVLAERPILIGPAPPAG